MRHPLSLEAFAQWLEQQPAAEQYDFPNPYECAICRYLDHIGLARSRVDTDTIYGPDGNPIMALPEYWNDVSKSCQINGLSTFGAAAARARALLGR